MNCLFTKKGAVRMKKENTKRCKRCKRDIAKGIICNNCKKKYVDQLTMISIITIAIKNVPKFISKMIKK